MSESLAPTSTHAEFFATQSEILKSRFLAEALLDKMDLEHSPEFKRGDPTFAGRLASWLLSIFSGPSNPMADARREELGKEITEKRVSVKREKNSRLLNLSMDAKDPEFARQMLATYIQLYLEQNLRKRRMVSQEAVSWLRSEQSRAEEKLVKSMAALVNFTNDHGMVSLEDASNHILKFFNSTAEGLVKSKELRVQLEALQKEGGQGLAVLPSDFNKPRTCKA